MGMQDGRASLAKAMKELMIRWADTRSQWNDAMANNFEKNRLYPLEQDMRQATSAMEHMGQIINQVRRDCQ